jgi:aminoglycoside phosphotransferase (APT) family kinase protein
VNPVASYIEAHHEALGLERLGIPRRPSCVLVTPGFRHSRHVVVLVLAEGRREPGRGGTLPRRRGDAAGLAREARNLRSVERLLASGRRGSTPSAIAFEHGPPHPLLLETALAGRPVSPAALRRDRDLAVESVAAWLEELAASSAAWPPDDGWHERLVSAPLRALAARPGAGMAALVERTLERAEALRDAALPLVFEHGDLCHPNLLLARGGRLGVLDWERSRPGGLPAHDLFFFLAYAASAGRNPPRALRTAFFGRTPWARRVAERYALRVGFDPALLDPLLAVACGRALAHGAALPRLVLLWRLSLGEAGE